MVKKLLKYNIFLVMFLFITYIPVHSTASAETIIQDDAGILSPDKEPELQNLCDNIYKEYNTSVYIWTDNNISGSDNFGSLMEQFVASQSNKDVIILMIGMYPGDRIYEIQGYGNAQNMLTDKRCSKILDYMYNDMADGNYYDAVKTFCQKSYKYMGKPPKLDNIIFSPVFQLVICLVAGIVTVSVIAYNSGGRTTTNSNTYLDMNNSRVIGSFDRYTHTTVTRTPKPKNNTNSSSGGGGSSHSSGGGRSF